MYRYCFSLYSNELKHHFGYTQEEIQGIGSANNLGDLTPPSCLNFEAAERTSQVFLSSTCVCLQLLRHTSWLDHSGLLFKSQNTKYFGQLWRRGLSEHSERPAV